MYGALFVLTQFLRFSLGFSALQTSVRGPAGRVRPARHRAGLGSARAQHRSQAHHGRGLVLIAAKLWQISGATFADTVLGMDLGLLTAAVVALAGALLALIWLPARSGQNQI